MLLVERNHASAEMYKLSLLLRGFAVDVAVDGEDGIHRALQGQPPDVIVMDLGLPRIDQRTPRRDELDALSTLRSLRPTQSIPIVAMSNDPQSFDIAIDRGATACIAKWRTSPRDLAKQVDQIVVRYALS